MATGDSEDEDVEVDEDVVVDENVVVDEDVDNLIPTTPAPPAVQNCGAMGMRTNEQGRCEDFKLFGPTPVLIPQLQECEVGDASPNTNPLGFLCKDAGGNGGNGGSSEDNVIAGIGEGGEGGQEHSQSQSNEPKHEQEHEGSGESND